MTSYLRRITPAMAVAVLALVVAISSSATAALMISGKQIKDHSITGKDLKKNAVNSKTIKNKSVKGKDLKKGAVKGSHVLDHSLTGADIRHDSITSDHLANGTITSSDLSTTLMQTINNGVLGFQVVTADSAPAVLPILAPISVSASCPAGKVGLSATGYWLGKTSLAPPQVRRTSNTTFVAETSSAVGVLGGDKLQIQVTCLSAG